MPTFPTLLTIVLQALASVIRQDKERTWKEDMTL